MGDSMDSIMKSPGMTRVRTKQPSKVLPQSSTSHSRLQIEGDLFFIGLSYLILRFF